MYIVFFLIIFFVNVLIKIDILIGIQ